MTQGTLLLLGSGCAGHRHAVRQLQGGRLHLLHYRLVLFGAAIGVLVGLYLIFMRPVTAAMARATMQNAEMAKALGVRTERIYALTFGLGAALAGLCGGLYAPTMTLSPMMGATFIIEAFVTVVAGGANVLVGTPPAGIRSPSSRRTALNASTARSPARSACWSRSASSSGSCRRACPGWLVRRVER